MSLEKIERAEKKYSDNVVNFSIKKSPIDQKIADLASFLGVPFEYMKNKIYRK